MANATFVFPPGYALEHPTTGDRLSGAVVRFYDAQTTNPKTVYSDADLTTALGTSVTTDALGFPTSDGTTRTQIYVGTAAYKLTIEDSDEVVLQTIDNIKGAVDALQESDISVTALRPVVAKSLDYTVLAGDANTHFMANTSGGDVTFTLPSAAALDNGTAYTFTHAGSANLAILATVSSQTIKDGVKSHGVQTALTRQGESLSLISDSGNWVITDHTGDPIKSGGVIPVVDRITAAPGSPVTGGYYLVSSAYSSFSTHDILFYTGDTYVQHTPTTDCGWTAWVADEDLYYQFRGTAWLSEIAARAAVQSDMETATSTTTFVTPGVVQYHPGVAKFWAKVDVADGVPSVAASHNVTSITDSGTGSLTVTIATDFSSANWAVSAQVLGGGPAFARIGSIAAGSVNIACTQVTGSGSTSVDPDNWFVAGFGDQA